MPEDFTNDLQRELRSSEQPCLVPFLKKSLPHLRQSLALGELEIEGVNPPPRTAVQIQPPSNVAQFQVSVHLWWPWNTFITLISRFHHSFK